MMLFAYVLHQVAKRWESLGSGIPSKHLQEGRWPRPNLQPVPVTLLAVPCLVLTRTSLMPFGCIEYGPC